MMDKEINGFHDGQRVELIGYRTDGKKPRGFVDTTKPDNRNSKSRNQVPVTWTELDNSGQMDGWYPVSNLLSVSEEEKLLSPPQLAKRLKDAGFVTSIEARHGGIIMFFEDGSKFWIEKYRLSDIDGN